MQRNRPEPIPSATVVVAREKRAASEFLLVRRHAQGPFGASYVFPGGMVEAQDRAAHPRCGGLSANAANRRPGLDGALDFYSAAIRELFEETGILLARDADGRMPPAAASPDAAQLTEGREKLLAGETAWAALLERHQLTAAADALTYFAWWITPVVRPRRFSTRFFLAVLPDGQTARHDGRELTDSRWMTAASALAALECGDIVLPPPTVATLRDLAALPHLDDIRVWAADRAEAGVPPTLPVIVSAAGIERILMPGDRDDATHAEGGSP